MSLARPGVAKRGFTLAEICVVLTMAAIILGMTVVSLRRPINKAGPRVVAEQTAEFMRRARQRAQKENSPVAVIFPSNGGASDNCQSVAERSGETHARISRIKDFSEENPDTVLFVGIYPPSDAWSIAPLDIGGSNSFSKDIAGQLLTARMIEWVGALSAEPMVIFLPDGSAVANDLPHLDGAYRIVVSQGIESTGGSVSDSGVLPAHPAIRALTKASNPYTITVEATGDVRVAPGLSDSDGSTPLSETTLALNNPAPRLNIDPQTSVDPVITELISEPGAGYLKGAFGIEQMVGNARQLTFRVVATQANDEALFCEFEERAGKGQFSSPGPKKMRYQPAAPPFYPEPSWRGTWQWTPPPGIVEGDLFTIDAKVTAARGGSTTTEGSATFSTDVVALDRGRIFFGAKNVMTGGDEIYCVRADGTDLNRVTYQEALQTSQSAPAASRDGNKLLYQSVDVQAFTSSLYGQSRRGGVSTLVTDKGVNPTLSDDGTVTVYQEFLGIGPGIKPVLYTVNPDVAFWPPLRHPVFNPDPSLEINQSSVGLRAASVSEPIPFDPDEPAPPGYAPDPDGRRVKQPRRIAFEANFHLANPDHVAIYTADFHDPGKSIEPNHVVRRTMGGPGGDLVTPGGDLRPVWHPDGKKLAFWSRRDGASRIYATEFVDYPATPPATNSGDQAVCLTPGFQNARDAYYSPDGKHLVFASDDHDPGKEWDLYILDLDPATGFLTPLGTPNRLKLGEYLIFSKLFMDINRPVWTL